MNVISSDQSPEIQVKSTTLSSTENFELCLTARGLLVAGSKLIVKVCSSTNTLQKWTIDQRGRFHAKDNDKLCIAKSLTNSFIVLQKCQNLKVQKFLINAFEDTINFRRNGLKIISVKNDLAEPGKPVKLVKRNYEKVMQQWTVSPSSLFINQQDIPTQFYIKSKGNSMCMEASGLTLSLNSCDSTKKSQKWRVNKYGVIKNEDNSKCITVGDNQLLTSGACIEDNTNMFMFNANDSSILLKRDGRKAMSIDNGDTVVLSKQILSEVMQQWNLIPVTDTLAPTGTPTMNPTAAPTPVPEIEVKYVGNPCTSFFSDSQCTQCTGDCDSDSDCAEGLRCAQRRSSSGVEIVPGCVWGPNSDDLRFDSSDYCECYQSVCLTFSYYELTQNILDLLYLFLFSNFQGFLPTSKPGFINYVGECDADTYLCGLCEGDCDSDSDCEGDLVCAERSGFAAVVGCEGAGGDRDVYGKDVCVPAQPTASPTLKPPSPTPMFPNSLKYKDSGCSMNDSCSKCEGPCNDDNNSCNAGLVCFVRTGSEPVPGCVTSGIGDISGADYCHEDPLNGNPTYIPGDMTKRENGLILSTGLTATRIARTGRAVSYTAPGGGQSSTNFHVDPDAGAVFMDTSGSNPGG